MSINGASTKTNNLNFHMVVSNKHIIFFTNWRKNILKKYENHTEIKLMQNNKT